MSYATTKQHKQGKAFRRCWRPAQRFLYLPQRTQQRLGLLGLTAFGTERTSIRSLSSRACSSSLRCSFFVRGFFFLPSSSSPSSSSSPPSLPSPPASWSLSPPSPAEEFPPAAYNMRYSSRYIGAISDLSKQSDRPSWGEQGRTHKSLGRRVLLPV